MDQKFWIISWWVHLYTVVLSLPGLRIPSTLGRKKVRLEERDRWRCQLAHFRSCTHLAYLPLHLLHCFLIAVNLLLRLSLVTGELLLHQIQLVRQSSAFNLEPKRMKCEKDI